MDKKKYTELYGNPKLEYSEDRISDLSDTVQEIIRILLSSQHFHGEDTGKLSKQYTRLRDIKHREVIK